MSEVKTPNKSEIRKNILEHYQNIGFPILKYVDEFDYLDSETNMNNYLKTPLVVEDALSDKIYEIRWHKDNEDLYKDLTTIPISKNEKGDLFVEEDLSNPTKVNIIFSDDSFNFNIPTSTQSPKEDITLTDFDDLDFTSYNAVQDDDFSVSTEKQDIDINELDETQIVKLEKLLKKSNLNLSKEINVDDYDKETKLWSIDEVDELYNKDISRDDKRAFLIWLQNKAKKQLKGEFYKKYGTQYPTPENEVVELLQKGKLFLDLSAPQGERFQPKVIYQSGNIWAKWNSITDVNKDELIARIGKKLYTNHVKTLREVYTDVLDKRLRVKGGSKDMRLVMLPISELAKKIKIDGYISPVSKKFKSKIPIYHSFKNNEVILDVTRTKGNPSSFVRVDKVTLLEAFVKWCQEAKEGEYSAKLGIKWSKTTKNVNDLISRYLFVKNNPYKAEGVKGEEKWEKQKDDARKVGTRLFAQFLSDGIQKFSQDKIETRWNTTYNSYKEPNLDQVPIGFRYKKFLGGTLFELRQFNIRAIKYYLTRGSVGLAYGVGIGKTFCAVFVMKQALDLGLVRRPLVIVPNQVYTQFAQEIYKGLGDKFNPMYVTDSTEKQNLTKYNVRTFRDKKGRYRSIGGRLNMIYNGGGQYNAKGNNAVNGINICTYEALPKMRFENKNLVDELNDIIKQKWLEEGLKTSLMARSSFKNVEILLRELERNRDSLFNENRDLQDEIIINSNRTDYDMVVVDEAHNFNALFSSVKSAVIDDSSSETIKREKNPYSSIKETEGSGEPSSRAKKLFWLSQYIQRKSSIKNTILLSATPFTNSPVQIYSMMAFLDSDMLRDANIEIIKDFFDIFAKIEYAVDFKTDLSLVNRNKLVGWTNIIALQKLIYRVFDKTSREDEDNSVNRPNKIVLPLKKKMINGKVYELSKNNEVSTTLNLSPLQDELWTNIKLYAQGGADGIPYEEIANKENLNESTLVKARKQPKEDGEIVIINPSDVSENKKSVRDAKEIRCLLWGRQLCLNPYLFQWSGFKSKPSAKEFIEQSPKLKYTMDCIKSVKDYHNKKGSEISGQVIYMNSGVGTYPILRQYLVEEIGFDINEIGIISGKGNFAGLKKFKDKKEIADRFMGIRFDEATGKDVEYSESERVKVLIGSQAIKEGINLQRYGSVLYNVYLDFNPTDQVQVEGRIWRQKNRYDNVRIVVPLMSDCIDIFMFQKLQDKTERINQIWTRSGNVNELDTIAFDPAELKYELVNDVNTLALLEKSDLNEKYDSRIVEESENYSELVNLEYLIDNHDKIVYKPFVFNSDFLNFQNNFYLNAYYVMNQLRPDLIDKPLFDNKKYKSYLKQVLNANSDLEIYAFEFSSPLDLAKHIIKNEVSLPTNLDIFRDDENDLLNDSQINTLNSLLNYSAEELLNIVVKFQKEEKIGFPRGMNKSPILWRDKNLSDAIFEMIEFVKNNKSTFKIDKRIENLILYNMDGNLNILGTSDFWKQSYQYIFNFIESETLNSKEEVEDELNNINSWLIFIENMNDEFGAYWNDNYYKWFDTIISKLLIDYRTSFKMLMGNKGLKNKKDLTKSINDSLNKLEQFKNEKSILNSEEYIEDIKDIVRIKQKELNQQDFRKGSQIATRVNQFANSNEDYLGNDMLDILFNPNAPKSVSIPKIQDTQVKAQKSREDLITSRLQRKAKAQRKKDIQEEIESLKEAFDYPLTDEERKEIEIEIDNLEKQLK
jgi:hypothetical protein